MVTTEVRRLKDKERYHTNEKRKAQVQAASKRNQVINRERNNFLKRESYLKNKDHLRAQSIAADHAKQEQYILRALRSKAKYRNLEFNLTIEDIVLPKECPVFKTPLIFGRGTQKHSPNAYSVDRIDSSKGYIKGNIQIISELANRMKQDATPEQLLMFSKWVKEIWQFPSQT